MREFWQKWCKKAATTDKIVKMRPYKQSIKEKITDKSWF